MLAYSINDWLQFNVKLHLKSSIHVALWCLTLYRKPADFYLPASASKLSKSSKFTDCRSLGECYIWLINPVKDFSLSATAHRQSRYCNTAVISQRVNLNRSYRTPTPFNNFTFINHVNNQVMYWFSNVFQGRSDVQNYKYTSLCSNNVPAKLIVCLIPIQTLMNRSLNSQSWSHPIVPLIKACHFENP